ncbi:MAG TPA: DUF6765 family protein [Fibrobacteraceae bacterium]|nr:DUF6765 family protein [Fibrobacteraceae bacterium]
MQIDFHHAVTYVVSRLAGFTSEEASVIATAAQYVDDATHSGVIHFDNRAMYHRISSAHKTYDPDNLNNDDNTLVWLPFHFLPGNGGETKGKDPNGSFIEKLICRPDSPIARDMLSAAFDDKNKDRALHRLGVAMHVFADTWAHQGFAGVLHNVNDVDNVKELNVKSIFNSGIAGFLKEKVSDAVPAIGHGRAFSLPDYPFLEWSYTNYKNATIKRSNTIFFMDAVKRMHEELWRFKNPVGDYSPIAPNALDQIRKNFIDFEDTDGGVRHRKWAHSIADGNFSFGREKIFYAEDGKYSWKAEALGTSSDMPVYVYSRPSPSNGEKGFLKSDWKLFHDAVQAHLHCVLHDILPEYGICGG